MGIVKKQVYKNAFISYTGMIIGYVNLVLLYTVYLTTEQFGLYQLLISLSVFYSLVSSMGVPAIILRYFPFFRTDDNKHNGFVIWAMGLAFAGFATVTAIYLLGKPLVVSLYQEKSALFIRYFYLLIPLAGFTIFYNVLEAFGKAIYQSVFSSFLREVLLKALTAFGILMLVKGWLNFDGFITYYIALNGLIAVCLLVSLALSKKYAFAITKVQFQSSSQSEIISFGLFALLTGSVYVLFQKVDILMLGSMAGLSVTAVYGFYSGIALVLNVPASALSRTTYQLVADAWKSKNMQAIADIYSKTSIIQMVIGCWLFIGVLTNKENLFAIIHKKDYRDHFDLFIVIGFSVLVDITGGLNTYILTTSNRYRLMTFLVGMSSLICIGLTYIMIPLYGGMGAALAYLITITAFNFCNWLLIKNWFNMQPFNYKYLFVIAIALVCYFAGSYTWALKNTYLDIAVRGSVVTIVYGLLCYAFRVSADLNEKVDSTLIKFGLKQNAKA